MTARNPANNAAIEGIALMEPMLPPEGERKLEDLAIDLTSKASALAGRVNPVVQQSIGMLVRAMNCYYSNLIEGHDTHPVDIERALRNDYSQDARKRDLQFEAKAHIAVQEWIDGGGLRAGRAVQAEAICEIHRRFCELLPE